VEKDSNPHGYAEKDDNEDNRDPGVLRPFKKLTMKWHAA